MVKTNSIITRPENFDEVTAYKVGTMADAMRVAQLRSDAMDRGEVDPITDPDPDPYGYMQELETNFNVDLMERRWKANPDEPLWVRRMTARGRRAAVSKLFLQGFKVQQIAQKVKVTEVTILKDLASINSEWRKQYLDDAEVLAARDMDRLEYYLTKLAPAIEKGDVKSIVAAVEIVKERGSILGYRQGVQIDIEQYVREVAESVGYDPDKAVGIANKISVSFK